MGDIADMMLDGTLCEGCGEYLGGESFGVPRYCSGCRRERRPARRDNPAVFEPIGAKQMRWLEQALTLTDNRSGMYPGIYIDSAPAQIRKLIARGLLEEYQPHNPVHKTRAIITDLGRAALEAQS